MTGSSVPCALEILDGAFMLLGGGEGGEGPEVAPLAGAGFFLRE
jgi:hypothetical protein